MNRQTTIYVTKLSGRTQMGKTQQNKKQWIATPFGLAMTQGRPVASATGQNILFVRDLINNILTKTDIFIKI
jgi:hypothetical protein